MGMPKPPAPPRPKPVARAPAAPAKSGVEPLAEVERALSILHGRHPEAVRADRETQAALTAKRAQVDALADRADRRERRRKRLSFGIGALGIALVAASCRNCARRLAEGRVVNAALAPIAAPYVALGFAPVSMSRFARVHEDFVAEKACCLVAIASGSGTLVVDRPSSGTLEGEGSIAWCSCGDGERAAVRLRDPANGGGLLVLRVDARQVGGGYGLPFLVPRPRVLASPDECSSGSLDAWLDDGRAPANPTEGVRDPELRSKLERHGFYPVASAPSSLPFAALPGTSEACAIAWSNVAGDTLSLRLEGGERPLAGINGGLAFCARNLARTTVWRDGTGELLVERVAAARVGGTHGVREAAARLGLGALETWVPDDELAWDGASTLRASGISAPEIATPADGRVVANANLIALSIRGAMVRADAQDSTPLCEPPLELGSSDAVCVQSRPLAWHSVGSVGHAGIAEAAFPFWMQALAGAIGTGVLPVELALLKMGRRLVAEGFEPTTLEGVTELGDVATITGRAGDDEIVAIQLTHEAPWVFPCSSGTPWTLGGDPAAVSIAPGVEITVDCLPHAQKPARVERRTVVFRHAAARAKAQ